MAKETNIKTDKKTVGGWGAWELPEDTLMHMVGKRKDRAGACFMVDVISEMVCKSYGNSSKSGLLKEYYLSKRFFRNSWIFSVGKKTFDPGLASP
jgi:hypothetical protein